MIINNNVCFICFLYSTAAFLKKVEKNGKCFIKNQKLDFPQNASAIIVNKVNNEYQLETVLNPK